MFRHEMCAALLAALVAGSAAAQTASVTSWPERVVKFVVPYGAGGGVDLFTRPIVHKLSEQMGAQLIVDNRPGAGGVLGVRMVARSQPDGYTLLGGGVHQPMAEHLYPKRDYDFGKDFIPIAVTAVVPNVLVVHPGVPFRQVKDLIAYAKANPGKLTYCSAGTGTAPHVIAELFKMDAGVRILHVPHTGTAASYLTLLGGNCDMTFDGLGTASAHIKSGKVIALALTSAKRSVYFPDIPTMAEAGGPAMDAGTWYGLWAPTGTPPPIVARLNREVMKALASPEIKAVWATQGAEIPSFELDQLRPFMVSEIARWTSIEEKAGIKLE